MEWARRATGRRHGRSAGGRSRARVAATSLALAVALGLLLGTGGGALAVGVQASLRVDPESSTVAGGATFTVNVIQNASVDTLGSQTDLVFDTRLVHLTDMKVGPVYAKALFLFGTSDDGSSASVAAAVARANVTGIVKNVATFLMPGNGTVAPGDAVVVSFTMQALQGPGGTTQILLQKPQMLDTLGKEIPAIGLTGGTVTVKPSTGASGALPASATSATPTATPSPVSSPGIAAVTVDPPNPHVGVGATAIISLTLDSANPVEAAAADIDFDKTMLEIVSIQPGSAWNGATMLGATDGSTLSATIAHANLTGVLPQVGVEMLPNSPSFPTGTGSFMLVTVRGLMDGTSKLTLARVTVLDSQGRSQSATSTDAQLVVGNGGGLFAGVNLLPIVGVAVGLALVAGIGFFLLRSRRRGGLSAGPVAVARSARGRPQPDAGHRKSAGPRHGARSQRT